MNDNLNEIFQGKVIASLMVNKKQQIVLTTQDGYKITLTPYNEVVYDKPS